MDFSGFYIFLVHITLYIKIHIYIQYRLYISNIITKCFHIKCILLSIHNCIDYGK